MLELTDSSLNEVYRVALLDVAKKWGEWSLETNYKMTFSTFADEFNGEKYIPILLSYSGVTLFDFYTRLRTIVLIGKKKL